MAPWSHSTTEELLALAVDVLTAGDRRGVILLGDVLTREYGAQFAATVTSALEAGAPLDTFDFLPAPGAPAEALPAPSTPPPTSPPPAADGVAPHGAGHPADSTERAGPPPRGPQAAGGPTRHRALAPGPPPDLPDSGYITAVEVAAHFGVSVKAVYRWMSTGRIRAERRPGGSYRIPADQFRE